MYYEKITFVYFESSRWKVAASALYKYVLVAFQRKRKIEFPPHRFLIMTEISTNTNFILMNPQLMTKC